MKLEKILNSSHILFINSKFRKLNKKISLNLPDKVIKTDVLLVAIGVKGNYKSVIGSMDIKVDNNFISTNKLDESIDIIETVRQDKLKAYYQKSTVGL